MKKVHHEHRKKWFDFLIPFTILTFIIGGSFLIYSSMTKQGNLSAQKKSLAAAPPPNIDTIVSNYPGIKIVSEISNDKNTPFALQYPQSKHEAFNQEIKKYINDMKSIYLIELKNFHQIGGERTGELNISFETYPHPSGVYSFVFLTNSYIGEANGTKEIRTFHHQAETGKLLSIEDLFENDIDRLTDIAAMVRDNLEIDPTLKKYLIPEKMHENTEPIWDNYRKFALKKEGLTFYFNQSEVADNAVGTTFVTIPYSSLNDLLADAYKIDDDTDNLTNQPGSSEEENKADESGSKQPTESETTPSVKRVALTFDDGPDPKVTTQILNTLKKYDAKATFFMLGSRVEYYPDIAKNVQAAGHEIGNHTWNHLNLNKADTNKIKNEIDKTSAIIEEVTGQKATLFRPPYGAFNDLVKAESNLPIALWNVDTLDWKYRDANRLLTSIKQNAKDGSIILMHDIHQSTADGLDAVLAYLKSEGYAFVTVSELN